MSGVSNADLLDLLKVTTSRYSWEGDFELLLTEHSTPALNTMLSKEHVLVTGGVDRTWNVQYRSNGEAKAVLINEVTDPAILSVQVQAVVPWRQYQTDWSINRQEMLRNKGRSKIIDLVKSRRLAGLQDMADLLEVDLWAAPPSITDEYKVYGVPYWFPKASSNGASGFNGQNPTAGDGGSFATCANIDASSSTYSKWRSYQASWANDDIAVNPADLAEIRRMFRQLKFISPVLIEGQVNAPARSIRYYSNDTVIGSLETAGDARNDQLGFDVARAAEIIAIKKVPVLYASRLDSDTENPLYGINHRHFKVMVLKGDYFRENEPMNDVRRHNTFTTYMDLTLQPRAKNRQRAGGVMSRAA